MAFPISASLLDACVLAALSESDMYGYALTQKLQTTVDVSESTLYPVLRRLEKDQRLRTYDQPYQGRNRRYYSITDKGWALLTAYREEWLTFREKMDQLLQKERNA